MSEMGDYFEQQDDNREAQGVECRHDLAWEDCTTCNTEEPNA